MLATSIHRDDVATRGFHPNEAIPALLVARRAATALYSKSI
jgi:hypothetical protein